MKSGYIIEIDCKKENELLNEFGYLLFRYPDRKHQQAKAFFEFVYSGGGVTHNPAEIRIIYRKKKLWLRRLRENIIAKFG